MKILHFVLHFITCGSGLQIARNLRAKKHAYCNIFNSYKLTFYRLRKILNYKAMLETKLEKIWSKISELSSKLIKCVQRDIKINFFNSLLDTYIN